jgi:hypothetical protein
MERYSLGAEEGPTWPHVVSIDLEKAYGKIIRMVMWWTDGETQSSNNTLV